MGNLNDNNSGSTWGDDFSSAFGGDDNPLFDDEYVDSSFSGGVNPLLDEDAGNPLLDDEVVSFEEGDTGLPAVFDGGVGADFDISDFVFNDEDLAGPALQNVVLVDGANDDDVFVEERIDYSSDGHEEFVPLAHRSEEEYLNTPASGAMSVVDDSDSLFGGVNDLDSFLGAGVDAGEDDDVLLLADDAPVVPVPPKSNVVGSGSSLDDLLSDVVGSADSQVLERGQFSFSKEDEDEDDDNEFGNFDLDALLNLAIDMEASDIHVNANDYPALTILGEIVRLHDFGVLHPQSIDRRFRSITTHVSKDYFAREIELDTSYVLRTGKHKGRRFRLNVGRSLGNVMMTFRVINDVIPSPEQLGISGSLLNWTQSRSGLYLFNGSTGTGKALALGTRIPTPSGWSYMGDLRVGDTVLDRFGNPCSVEWLSDVNFDPLLFAVTLSDGQKIIADKDHQWFVRDSVCGVERVLDTSSIVSEFADGRFSLPVVYREGYSLGFDCFSGILGSYYDSFVSALVGGFDTIASPLVSVGGVGVSRVLRELLFADFDSRLSVVSRILGCGSMFGDDVSGSGFVSFDVAGADRLSDIVSLLRSVGLLVTVDANVLNVVYDFGNALLNDVVSVVPVVRGDVDFGPVRCIGVDSFDMSYLCADFVVTHNSTSLASLIRKIQLERSCKIVTIERPIEFIYGSEGKALVVQREVGGNDTRTFGGALDSSMRQAPDIILLGEVRNREEISSLLRAAESGHLAISTMHTNSASATVNRIKSTFDGDEQVRILGTLSEVALGFANQVLVKSADGASRFAVREILEINEEVSRLILNGDVKGIQDYQFGEKITLEHELVRAVLAGKCNISDARMQAVNLHRFDKILESRSV